MKEATIKPRRRTPRATPSRSTAGLVEKFGLNGEALAGLKEYARGVSAQNFATFFLRARSAPEVRFRALGKTLLEATYGCTVIFIGYEWFSFKIPGGSYTPDLSYLLDSGLWVHVEVKASASQKNYRDARSKLRAAASLNPWMDFYEVRQETNFTLEKIEADPCYLALLSEVVRKDTF